MKIDPVKLKKAIDDSGLTAKEVATAAGWSVPNRVWQILKGRGTNINPRIAEAIAKKLKVKLMEIQKGNDDE